ncbi:MAG: hypothetical protein V3Q69_04440 [Burkholderia sp.]
MTFTRNSRREPSVIDPQFAILKFKNRLSFEGHGKTKHEGQFSNFKITNF